MKRIAVSAVAWFVASSVVPTFGQTPNLSGTWQLDTDASQITAPLLRGGGDGGPADTLHITHAANGTVVVGNEVNAAKAWAYRLDSESSVPVWQGRSLTVSSRWDGDRLVTEGSQAPAGDDAIIRLREIRTLSEDGRTLTVEVTTMAAAGENTNILVYRKIGS